MKSSSIVGGVLIVGALGAGVYFLWPRKKSAPAAGYNPTQGSPKNPIGQLNQGIKDATQTVQGASALVNQLGALGANIGKLFGGSDESPSAGQKTTQTLEGSAPGAKSVYLTGGPTPAYA